MTRPVIALLGRKDEPTDAVEEYCRYLGTALVAHEIQLEICRVPWEIYGWPNALDALQHQAKNWRGVCVLVQYTALAWSSRGFPHRFLRVLKMLKSAGARVGIIYHDVEPYHGERLIDFLRRFVQLRTMHRALVYSDVAIFTVPLDNISWLAGSVTHAHFIPVGPNLPIPETRSTDSRKNEPSTIGVFSITGGAAGAYETQIIISAVRYAAERLGKLRLLIFGRNAELREAELRRGISDFLVDLSVEGVVQADQVVQRLSACDLLLFVRGPISSRRSSAIAGIACGLPVVAFQGPDTVPPITEAGLVLVPSDRPDQLSAALVRVLSERGFRDDLAARSRVAFQSHFAWPSIAARFATILDKKC